MSSNSEIMTLLRIAKAYYIDGLSQQEIAAKENIHRTQISRLLKQAREEGYVEIRISAPNSETSHDLAKQVKKQLKLDDVFVTPPISSKDPKDQNEALAFFAARYLETNLPHYHSVGVGLGSTMYNIGLELSPQKVDHDIDFYAMSGHIGSDNPYLQTNIINDRFSQAFGGQTHYNNYPIITTAKSMSENDLKRLQEMREHYKNLDAIVVSLGGSFTLDYPYFKEFYNQVKNFNIQKFFAQPHGHICGNVYFLDGRKLMLPDPFIFTSMKLGDMQNVKNSICVAAGPTKVDSIIAASQYKYIKTLITDQATAKQILNKLELEKENKQ